MALVDDVERGCFLRPHLSSSPFLFSSGPGRPFLSWRTALGGVIRESGARLLGEFGSTSEEEEEEPSPGVDAWVEADESVRSMRTLTTR